MRRKLLSLALALWICLGLSIPALASEAETPPTYEEALRLISLSVDPDVDKDTQGFEESLDLRGEDGEPIGISMGGFYQVPLDSTFQFGNISNRSDCFVFVARMLYENDGTGAYHQVKNWGGFFTKDGDLAAYPAGTSVSFSVGSAKFAGRDLVLRISCIIAFYRQDGDPTLYPFMVDFRFDTDGEPADQQPAPAETPEPTEEPQTPSVPPASAAVPTSAAVLVNGEQKAFDAYSIDGSNYFKLRDLAYVVNGTDKQFQVGWDGEANAISLTSGEAYTPAGGEMEVKSGGKQTAKPTSSKIILDGKEVSLTAYEIGGNNYFKLRDIGQTFDFGIGWDDASRTITIDTSVGYTA